MIHQFCYWVGVIVVGYAMYVACACAVCSVGKRIFK